MDEKVNYLQHKAIQDIESARGLMYIGGDSDTKELLLYIPVDRIKDVVYFCPHDREYPIGLNLFAGVVSAERHIVASTLTALFKCLWKDGWSAEIEYMLNTVFLTLTEYPQATIVDILPLLSHTGFRNSVLETVSDPSVRSFWNDEFSAEPQKFMSEAGDFILEGIGSLVSNPIIHNIVGQENTPFHFRGPVREHKIVVADVSSLELAHTEKHFLAGLLLAKLYGDMLSIADQGVSLAADYPRFPVYLEDSFAYFGEFLETYRAEAEEKGVTLVTADPLVTPGFSLGEYPLPIPDETFGHLIVEHSRSVFGRPRAEVEAEIAARVLPGMPTSLRSLRELREIDAPLHDIRSSIKDLLKKKFNL